MRPMLTLSRLSKSFGRLQAVQDITFQVSPGQIVGLIGPNGSGKSTLLNCITGTIPPDSGRVIFEGHDITGASPDVVFRRGIARSHQDPALFQRMSVLDNTPLPATRPVKVRWLRLFTASGGHRKTRWPGAPMEFCVVCVCATTTPPVPPISPAAR